MNVGWQLAKKNFQHDDGSLPGVEFRELAPTSVQLLFNYFRTHGTVVSTNGTLWDNAKQCDVPVESIADPAGLVVSGVADPFHCCFSISTDGLTVLPDLGLFVYRNCIEIDFRMGDHWTPVLVDSFFRILAQLKLIALEAVIESAECEGLLYPEEFKMALNRYIETGA